MLNKLERKTDKFVVWARELSSRGISFLIVMLGVLLQASHTTLLMFSISAFSQFYIKLITSMGIGIFISISLAVFTLKHDGTKKSKKIINTFFFFEIFTNIFYFWNSLVFQNGFYETTTQQWLYLGIAMPFSFIMPYTIKKFANVIYSDKPLNFGSIDKETEEGFDIDGDKYNDKIQKIQKDFKDYTDLKVKEENKELRENMNKKLKKEIDGLELDNYIKKGSKMKLTINDKTSIVKIN